MNKPPALMAWLLKRLLNPDLLNGIYGDLLEDYNADCRHHPKWKANFNFLKSGIGFIRFPFLLHLSKNKNQLSISIWKNYFKISIRSIVRNKITSIVSATGLIVSFMSSMAIIQYVLFEKNYDNFHEDTERLFRVTNKMTTNSGTTLNAVTFFGTKEDFLNEIPEVTSATQVFSSNSALLTKGDQSIMEEEVIFVTPEFFDMFNFPLLEGECPDHRILTPSISRKKLLENFSKSGCNK